MNDKHTVVILVWEPLCNPNADQSMLQRSAIATKTHSALTSMRPRSWRMQKENHSLIHGIGTLKIGPRDSQYYIIRSKDSQSTTPTRATRNNTPRDKMKSSISTIRANITSSNSVPRQKEPEKYDKTSGFAEWSAFYDS